MDKIINFFRTKHIVAKFVVDGPINSKMYLLVYIYYKGLKSL